MDKIIFSETNIFILSKLVALVRRESGNRHRLSDERSVTALLQECSEAGSGEIESYFRRFVSNLHASHIEEFKSRGVIIPDDLDTGSSVLPAPINRQYAFVAH